MKRSENSRFDNETDEFVVCPEFNNSSNKIVDLTSARFRMLINSGDYAKEYQPKIENNDPPQRYSVENLVNYLEEISYESYDEEVLIKLINAQRLFRHNYFQTYFCKLSKPIISEVDLLLYCLNKNPKPGVFIDKVIQWFPVFPSIDTDDAYKTGLIKQDRVNFKKYIQYYYLKLLLEYYEIADDFPYSYMVKCIELLEQHISNLLTNCLVTLRTINEVCKKCGELFNNKTDLIDHHELNACRLPPTHHCQCGQFFMTHDDWMNHCLCVQMSCPTFAWHIWRYKRSDQIHNNKMNFKINSNHFYSCDGCQYSYDNFLQYWHHICNCPFSFSYLIGNCPYCTDITKKEYFNLSTSQERLRKPHSDFVGIKIIQEWAKIKDLEFKVKVAGENEPTIRYN